MLEVLDIFMKIRGALTTVEQAIPGATFLEILSIL
jgi:hypothetical protein